MSLGSAVAIRDLSKIFPSRSGAPVAAVRQASLELALGETLALVGESGSGKTTLGLMMAGLLPPSSGTVRLFDGIDPYALSRREARRLRKRIQWIPQMPSSSLNPRFTVRLTLEEPLRAHGLFRSSREAARQVEELLGLVGLEAELLGRHARELSLGQQQRLAIARALSVEPEVLICDEITSGLDACLKVQILTLLGEIQSRLGVASLFITHNLAAAQWFGQRIAIMHEGRIMESGSFDGLAASSHPYTRALINAADTIRFAAEYHDRPPPRSRTD